MVFQEVCNAIADDGGVHGEAIVDPLRDGSVDTEMSFGSAE
jgi:hypothetical protein